MEGAAVGLEAPAAGGPRLAVDRGLGSGKSSSGWALFYLSKNVTCAISALMLPELGHSTGKPVKVRWPRG